MGIIIPQKQVKTFGEKERCKEENIEVCM